jgi:surfactin synthase thioesterase subunit
MSPRPGRWFATPAPPADAEVLLFCLPYAGGGAAAYRRWDALTPPGLGVEPVHLPGRERRISEPPALDPVAITDAVLARAARRPFGRYGHSMGARLGHEVTAELRRRGGPLPLRLAVGGARPPDEVDPVLEIVTLPDDGFARELVEMGGTPAEVMENGELRELLLPTLRADFTWLRDTPPPRGEPLPVPIDAYAGDADPVAGPAEMTGWERHTSAGFTLRTVPGDHFLIAVPPPALLGPLAADLLLSARAAR